MMSKKVAPTALPAQVRRRRTAKLAFGVVSTLSVLQIAFLFTGCSSPLGHGSFGVRPPESKTVSITARREGEMTHFYVENKEFCEVTMTFEMEMVNLEGSSKFPYTTTFPAHESTEAFTVSPIEPEAKWEYNYTNYYKLGSNRVRHNDSCIYELPYAPGHKFKVTQGYNGSFSHKGSNQYAIDWQMPEGTPVRAARGGMVVRVRDDSDTGGSSMKFDRYNNYVLIRHPDGTMGHYCHLQKGGCVVKPGQTVETGDVIAHSGNTGFSSGAHLHFCVFKTKDGRERESIPVKFRTAEERAVTLVSGQAYKATTTHTPMGFSAKTGVHFGASSAP